MSSKLDGPKQFMSGKKFKKCEGCEFWKCDLATYEICREMGAAGRKKQAMKEKVITDG